MPVILVAPDSFKGTFSAREVAQAIARGLRAAGRDAVELPVGDGGEGTMDALVAALGGQLRTAVVSDPLGQAVEATFALLPDGETAIVETAQASGLWRVSEEERDAWAASTRGTGELIAAAAKAGASMVIVTVGGSATTDGGLGAIEALAEAGVDVQLDVLCDVRSAWEDAPRLYGPQKGADPATVARLERRLDDLAQKAPRDPRGVAYTGSAGGLSGGLWAFRGARLFPGAAYVLDALGFDERLREATFVVTGEGRLDSQTLEGKIVAEVALRCPRAGVPCHAVVGQNALGPDEVDELGVASVREASTLEELEAAGRTLATEPRAAPSAGPRRGGTVRPSRRA
jgi:glycerate kinase